MKIQEYDRVALKDGRIGTVVAGAPDGPYSVDIGATPETWDNIFVEHSQIEKVIKINRQTSEG